MDTDFYLDRSANYVTREKSKRVLNVGAFVNGGKLISFVLILYIAFHHGFITNYDSCQSLLHNGRMVSDQWQPRGCRMHNYSSTDAQNCMKTRSGLGLQNNIYFVGDSRTEAIFFKMRDYVAHGLDSTAYRKFHDKMAEYEAGLNLHLNFIWSGYVAPKIVNECRQLMNLSENSRPNLLVMGAALHNIAAPIPGLYSTELEDWQSVLDVMGDMNRESQDVRMKSMYPIWLIQAPIVDGIRNNSWWPRFHNKNIEKLNSLFAEALANSSVRLWYTYRKVGLLAPTDQPDGYHFRDGKIMDTHLSILLNLYCNNIMNYTDGTCCRKFGSIFEPLTLVQFLILAVTITSCIIFSTISIRRVYRQQNNTTKFSLTTFIHEEDTKDKSPTEFVYNMTRVTLSIMKLGVIILYLVVSERIRLIVIDKQYPEPLGLTSFYILVVVITIVGLIFSSKTDQTTILYSDQIDEIKGWLQLVITIYHITGVTSILPHSMEVQLVVSTYLFLFGFSHISYYFSSGKYSLNKFSTKLVRYNFLVVLLWLILEEPYRYYGFVPVVSSWFVVVYIAMAGWNKLLQQRSRTRFCILLVLKMGIFLWLIDMVTERNGQSWLKNVAFHMDDNFSYHLLLDKYTVLSGMAFCSIIVSTKPLRFLDGPKLQNVLLRITLYSISIIGLVCYVVIVHRCSGEEQCFTVHSRIVILLIVSYLCLRCLPLWLRSRYSRFLAWFGKFALEMYIVQHHLLQSASDERGPLTLISNHPFLNLLVTTFVFIFVSHELHTLIKQFLDYL